MAKLILKRTTNTTVTEEIELIPAVPGEEQEHRYLKVCDMDHIAVMTEMRNRSRRLF